MSILLTGLAASSGITIAPAHLLVESDLSIKKQHTADENHEVARLHDSFALSKTELQHLSKRAHELLGQRAVTIIDTQIAILDDPTLQKKIIDRINSHHDTAEWAVKRVEDYYLSIFERKNDNEYLYARATALRDVTKRVLSHLLNVPLPDPGLLDHRAIFVANNITPTDTAQFDKRYVAGIVTTNGGRTSHFTIMSKTLSLPAVVGVKDATAIIHDSDLLIVDGIHGKVIVNPTKEEVEHYRLLAGKFIQEQQKWGALKDKQTVSADGRRFEVGANVGTFADVIDAQEDGAEGIGLLRTEFLYMSKDELPTEEQQFNAYKRFVSAMNGQRVVARTLDIGGDKKLGMVALPHEDNPYLGFRAIRIGLARPEILRPQLRALLRASVYGRLAIMFPMIATIEEFQAARAILDDEKEKLEQAGIQVAKNIEVGMMLEIPAVAVMAEHFAKYVDFFSIGSNDLIQYLFAVDRGNQQVAYLYQELHPAVLRMVRQVIEAAHAEGKWVGMCGEMANNPYAVPLLMAMGLDEFSMSSSQILRVRSLINQLNTRKLQPLVHRAIHAETAAAVQELVEKYVPQVKL
ncbi:phosphoenolpyruvate--protein phosphotransferase [Limosilactobacillus reuteri]|uniref:Phosphoenolpyruvate-protein phosphotransferase n=1 Tax=Limosilactobacillus reuteri TaxID=1598 RepID=A0AAW6JD74_LIMRT|nr:phosphoenolpyruvate--protein phosphotransferase [Limosilactobacillus reuteri]MCC4477630.1 phosphoenolpyruvate--protein phosphotransferase [Limosilactobacillus reuteri]MCC4479812.1 phosphoenolpyruvate--protein phosphotransferase [Limosilactobacillus reuteri]MCC4489569.1 phosphoenolpyruvate--protein phosphotransferase [Limosilactobacillus reuteri]MCC4494040.1 phosphoenolpyruvate--protein phosphotransferase [Limosilactobacillus reuteri]MCC4496294.1 phosphoenolpyruvate--protein phosphotransfera